MVEGDKEPVVRAPEDGRVAGRGESHAPRPAATTSGRRRGAGIAVSLLVLVLLAVLAAGAAWLPGELQRRDGGLQERLVRLEAAAAGRDAALAALRQAQDEASDPAAATAQRLDTLQGHLTQLQNRLERIEARLADQAGALARLRQGERSGPVLSESRSLLRLADYRLRLAGDVATARDLLREVDGMLALLEEPALDQVRAAIASDLAALRGALAVDTQGIWARLSALRDQVRELAFLRPPGSGAAEGATPEGKGALEDGPVARVLEKLSAYLVLRRREADTAALLNPQWARLLRQNLELVLGQAQLALQSRDEALYQAALDQALSLLATYPPRQSVRTDALRAELQSLRDVAISAPLPDLRASRGALEQARARKRAAGDT